MTTQPGRTPLTQQPDTPDVPPVFQTVQPLTYAPALDREKLRRGAIVVYLHTNVARSSDRPNRPSKQHTFALGTPRGPQFMLFGTVGLDACLRGLSVPVTCLVRYDGTKPNPQPDNKEAVTHLWTVRAAPQITPSQLAKAREPFAGIEKDLIADIASARDAWNERKRQGREHDASSDDDGWGDAVAADERGM